MMKTNFLKDELIVDNEHLLTCQHTHKHNKNYQIESFTSVFAVFSNKTLITRTNKTVFHD